ncbi:glutamyl-tRNA(Gln) amidotransferase subunit A [Pyrenophora tritici-repentis Pt-1C-BFP]|uniref:Glutamyl-tRNA(Gln) amidotransferase subunit A n=1 Tax=Pyrenophora tritici-repentis (strain Pt-1C-BFP) TaxID=426418 RepID=B2WNS8_PYRTR|nr:glutamyl-tRNA(Gln) amidotransferase subunit A [Pyrenophora tritici-repentis Pt-1C-BFP]EDU44688.1 glutamyl-tRNA(Gln) amidotransferase subunit A [Pyrenophora tritici-repentis Pt-1C-BFP]
MAKMASDSTVLSFDAKPYAFSFPLAHTALLIIDMQRDFLLAKGFGEIQGGNLKAVQASIAPTKRLLEACRGAGMAIFHTREGHKPDLSDCPSAKLIRQEAAPGNTQHKLVIGDKGELGRLLTRGEHGHDIIDELFLEYDHLHQLKARAITHLIVSGVTTECCFATTIREANDRGFECCGIEEATSGYNDACFKETTLDMIHWSQGLFGFIGCLEPLLGALAHVSTKKIQVASTPPQTPRTFDGDLTIPALQQAYKNGLSPVTVSEAIYDKIKEYQKIDSAVWIHLQPREAILEAARRLELEYPDRSALPPLFGVPFSAKDSIDVAGIPTTTACPPLTHVPSVSAPVYEKVMAEGALFVGKTNLDQLATGLVGCRSPYGIPHSVYHKDYISGGSSSGSTVSVGASLVSFSLATDTAGSGRVPAGFNGIVGYKPTRGTISFRGITPACLSLDCIALSTKTVSDARTVWQILEGHDPLDPYAKPQIAFERHINSIGPQSRTFKFGVPPPEALAICSTPARRMFNETILRLQKMGGVLTQIDWSPFQKAGQLLYDGTFVSERLASLPDDFLGKNRSALHPVTVQLMDAVTDRKSSAVDAYRDLQAKALYTRQAEQVFAYSASGVDVIVVPTAPTHWKIKEVLADPIRKNSTLGEFTHCGNVLDLCGVAVPAGTYPVAELSGQETDEGVLPFSITLLSGSRLDAELLEIARRFEKSFTQ